MNSKSKNYLYKEQRQKGEKDLNIEDSKAD